ncbi:MAG TPA: hypothetical protein VN193_11905 [Candidatus Angelobacter sp.]|jgi:hypothetical protein|nr:hypothetical protein [Candidatus Angelobacter sp.]
MGQQSSFRVTGVPREQIDLRALALVLLRAVREQEERERKRAETERREASS